MATFHEAKILHPSNGKISYQITCDRCKSSHRVQASSGARMALQQWADAHGCAYDKEPKQPRGSYFEPRECPGNGSRHAAGDACFRCCEDCNYDNHRCPACDQPKPHHTYLCYACQKLNGVIEIPAFASVEAADEWSDAVRRVNAAVQF